MKKLLILLIVLMPLIASAEGPPVEMELVGNHSLDDNKVFYADAALTIARQPFSARFQGKYASTNKDATTNKLSASFNFDEEISFNWEIWACERAVKDNVSGTFENFLGIGPKYVIYQHSDTKASVSAGYLNHLTEYEDGSSRTKQRASFRFKAKRHKDNNLTSFVAFYQPDIEDRRDFLASAVFEVGKTSKHTFAGLVIEGDHKSVVPEDTVHNRVYTGVKFRYKWGDDA